MNPWTVRLWLTVQCAGDSSTIQFRTTLSITGTARDSTKDAFHFKRYLFESLVAVAAKTFDQNALLQASEAHASPSVNFLSVLSFLSDLKEFIHCAFHSSCLLHLFPLFVFHAAYDFAPRSRKSQSSSCSKVF